MRWILLALPLTLTNLNRRAVWELLCLCLSTFAPSGVLAGYLKEYVPQHLWVPLRCARPLARGVNISLVCRSAHPVHATACVRALQWPPRQQRLSPPCAIEVAASLVRWPHADALCASARVFWKAREPLCVQAGSPVLVRVFNADGGSRCEQDGDYDCVLHNVF